MFVEQAETGPAGQSRITISATFSDPDRPAIEDFAVTFRIRLPGADSDILAIENLQHGAEGLTIVVNEDSSYTAQYSFEPLTGYGDALYDVYFEVSDGSDMAADSLTGRLETIAPELEDTPADSANPESFSHPDQVLSMQIVHLVPVGALAPGSGTFTEKLVFSSPDPALGEDVYVYNAELKLPFNQQADTVYWLKIAALVDDSSNFSRWGWHNRDYTSTNGLFAAVFPGERDEQPLIDPAYPTKVWHFQDDAVSAQTSYVLNADGTWSLTFEGSSTRMKSAGD